MDYGSTRRSGLSGDGCVAICRSTCKICFSDVMNLFNLSVTNMEVRNPWGITSATLNDLNVLGISVKFIEFQQNMNIQMTFEYCDNTTVFIPQGRYLTKLYVDAPPPPPPPRYKPFTPFIYQE